LATYMEKLRHQLSRLKRFREISFGPYSVARHQSEAHMSWFFRRRSLPSLTDSTPTATTTRTTMHEQPALRYS
uniref:Uncharacterized protein n=1 Tax=Gongylonema pulchrum TaxID=637853 RepID=A0A183DA05_9BILA